MLIKRAYGLSSERGVRVNFPSSKLLPLLGFEASSVTLERCGWDRLGIERMSGEARAGFGYRARLKFYSSSKDRN